MKHLLVFPALCALGRTSVQAVERKTAVSIMSAFCFGQHDQPFFLMLGFHKPHMAWNVPPEILRPASARSVSGATTAGAAKSEHPALKTELAKLLPTPNVPAVTKAGTASGGGRRKEARPAGESQKEENP
jgi:hypothetical protein